MPAQKSQEQFVADAKNKHDNKYDYSKFIYENSKTKGIIGCSIHGDFIQAANNHLNGQGCPKCGIINCANSNRLGQEDFLLKAKQRHGFEYDYSKFIYIDAASKGIIGCKKHGDFLQGASNHLQGQGCPKCAIENGANNQRKNIGIFLTEANQIHNNRYDYSKFIYTDYRTKGIIICKEHGDFTQTPGNHLADHGCPDCGQRDTNDAMRKDLQTFITEANEKHNFKYDYSKFIYIGAHIKGIIICKEHGEFRQNAHSHTRGQGCYECGVKTCADARKKDINTFIAEANEVHNFKYDYSKFIYTTALEKSIIICKKHGAFEQQANSHLMGRGCPKCLHKNEQYILAWLENNLAEPTTYQYAIRYNNTKHIFDFYIPQLNIIIEYNGPQHYGPIKFGSMSIKEAQSAFEDRQIRDAAKRQYCKEKNFNFIEIDGREIYNKDNVEIYLDRYLGQYSKHNGELK